MAEIIVGQQSPQLYRSLKSGGLPPFQTRPESPTEGTDGRPPAYSLAG